MTSQFIAESSDEDNQDDKEVSLGKILPHANLRKRYIYESEHESEQDEYQPARRIQTYNSSKITRSKKKVRNMPRKRGKSRKTVSEEIQNSDVSNITSYNENIAEPNTPPPEPQSPMHKEAISTEKPHYTYATMIAQALSAQPDKRLTLQGIYQWIMNTYPFYKNDEHGWRSSVRHNLSQKEYFSKVADNDRGRRAVYELNKRHEENLLKGLTGRKLAKHLKQETEEPKKKVIKKKQISTPPPIDEVSSQPLLQLPFTWFNPTWSYANNGGQSYQPLNLFRPIIQLVNADQVIHSTKSSTVKNVLPYGHSEISNPPFILHQDMDQTMYVSEPPPSPEPCTVHGE